MAARGLHTIRRGGSGEICLPTAYRMDRGGCCAFLDTAGVLSPTSGFPQSHAAHCRQSGATLSPASQTSPKKSEPKEKTREKTKENILGVGDGPPLPAAGRDCQHLPFLRVTKEGHTALVASSSLKSRTTAWALGCFHLQRFPAAFHITVL